MIRTLAPLARFEWLRLARSPMRAAAVVVFLLCGVYAIGSGEHHVEGWRQTLADLEERETEQREEALSWFGEGRAGPEDRPYIDVSQPLWADRHASAHAAMSPEPLAGLAIGLSDVRATWAGVSATRGAKPFQTSDPATLGNAERLLAGNFDLAFVFAYLLPLLLLVLLFDVGALERDLGMLRMVRVQSVSPRSWLLLRIALPVLLVAALAAGLCVAGGLWTGALGASSGSWAIFSGLVLGYTLLWGVLYGAVLSAGTGVATAALWMVGLWLGLCVVAPASVRQIVGQEHPSLYASELTTALRADRYEIYMSDPQEHEDAFRKARPELPEPADSSRGAARTRSLLIQQAAFLDVVSQVTEDLAREEAAREAAVARYGWVNPAYVLQRTLCVLAGTESVSFRAHRADVLACVNLRLDALVDAAWHEAKFDRNGFQSLFAHGPRRHYGGPPEPGVPTRLLGLTMAGAAAAWLLGRARADRERNTGVA